MRQMDVIAGYAWDGPGGGILLSPVSQMIRCGDYSLPRRCGKNSRCWIANHEGRKEGWKDASLAEAIVG